MARQRRSARQASCCREGCSRIQNRGMAPICSGAEITRRKGEITRGDLNGKFPIRPAARHHPCPLTAPTIRSLPAWPIHANQYAGQSQPGRISIMSRAQTGQMSFVPGCENFAHSVLMDVIANSVLDVDQQRPSLGARKRPSSVGTIVGMRNQFVS
jgi:hypothetical protein